MNNIRSETVKKIYRYLKFDLNDPNRKDLDRLEQIIIQNKLYFSNPKDFNDPFDSKILFTFDGCTDDNFRFFYLDFIPENRKRRPDLWSSYKHLKPREFAWKVSEIVEERIRSGTHRDPQEQGDIRKAVEECLQPEIYGEDTDKNSGWGVLCLSENRDDILMWSHYADGHKGLCLEFDKEKLDNELNSPIKGFVCKDVEYPEDYRQDWPYPKFIEFYKRYVEANKEVDKTRRERGKATEELGRFVLCRKMKYWEYECEWRVIKSQKEIAQNDGRLFSYTEGMLTGIILGCQTDKDQQAEIERMISGRSAKPRLFKACRNDDEFKLDIKELD